MKRHSSAAAHLVLPLIFFTLAVSQSMAPGQSHPDARRSAEVVAHDGVYHAVVVREFLRAPSSIIYSLDLPCGGVEQRNRRRQPRRALYVARHRLPVLERMRPQQKDVVNSPSPQLTCTITPPLRPDSSMISPTCPLSVGVRATWAREGQNDNIAANVIAKNNFFANSYIT